MKVVIIGAGIGGLTLANYLNRKGMEVVLNERGTGTPGGGHAFLMHTDGLAILKDLADGAGRKLPGKPVDQYSLRRPGGEEVQCLKLDKWRCVKRTDLTAFLYDLLPAGIMKEDRYFTHFIYEEGKVVAAAFANGELEYGDIFVGADGGYSKVREGVFGPVEFRSGKVKEVVGMAYNKEIAGQYRGVFTKFQSRDKGLAFGLIPTCGEELVWFMQYDPVLADVQEASAEGIGAFCRERMAEFPAVVQEVLKSNDFSKTYIWNTRDFDLLPTFSKDNVVLIGDAAHLALPFTSAGTTNSMLDARMLAEMLEQNSHPAAAFTAYYEGRAAEVSSHLTLGRTLRDLFLKPLNQADADLPVPLMSNGRPAGTAAAQKPLRMLYFTDPICSTCWIIQPVIRKLKLLYGDYLDLQYCMGGLLPSWTDYASGCISKPSDAAEHWEEACLAHDMPMDGDVWIEDPLYSSYPPSIAFKAAQLQDPEKAIGFFRRIQEMVFLEKKNIIKWEYLREAALDNGLDAARLLRDFDGKAKALFEADLELGRAMGVTSFPTMFLQDGQGREIKIKGLQSFEKMEEYVLSLCPDAVKKPIDTNPESLFCEYPTMTAKEFSFLSGLNKEDAMEMLNALLANGSIDCYQSKNGMIWISKYDCLSCGA